MARYGYVRVSTDMQDYKSQKSAIKSRFKIDRWIEDTGTGKVTQPNLLKLSTMVTDKDEIIIHAFDRLGRKTHDVLTMVNIFKEKGVSIISIREGIDLNSPVGNMVFQMMCSIAEYESTVIGDRIKHGMRAAKNRGVRLGRTSLFTDPDKAEAMKQAAKLRQEGLSFRKIKKKLIEKYNISISIAALCIHLRK